jgi:hypothetical protein
MHKFSILLALIIVTPLSWAQSNIEESIRLNAAYIDGVYWNPSELPGWGFFIDVQESTLFGAVYGYLGDDSTFITMQGTQSPTDELVFSGDVFFVTDGGTTISDVGDFTWSTTHSAAVPASKLTLSSNILNVTDLELDRFSYAESDKLDMLTGGNWNIKREISGVTFGDNYFISDQRMTNSRGDTYVPVIDNSIPELAGSASYDPDENGGIYCIFVEFTEETDAFYVFWANDTDMFGRYWILFPGETPSGTGNHFRGAIDTFQNVSDNDPTNVSSNKSDSGMARSTQSAASDSERKATELSRYQSFDKDLAVAFPASQVQSLYEDCDN